MNKYTYAWLLLLIFAGISGCTSDKSGIPQSGEMCGSTRYNNTVEHIHLTFSNGNVTGEIFSAYDDGDNNITQFKGTALSDSEIVVTGNAIQTPDGQEN